METIIMYKMGQGIYNFKTCEYEYITESPPDWRDYIPQDAAVQGYYECLIKMGDSPAEAARKTLLIIVGDNQ
jgi:hypothetical protein